MLSNSASCEKNVSFEYNTEGIRTEKHVSGEYDVYYRLDGNKVVEACYDGYNLDCSLVFVYDESGNPYGFDYYSPSSATTPTRYFYVLNLQGDVVKLLDSDNDLVADY